MGNYKPKTEEGRKILENNGLTEKGSSSTGSSISSTGSYQPKTDEGRRILAKYGAAEYTEAEKKELQNWANLANRGFGNLQGYVNQLQKDDWKSSRYDRNYRQGLGQQIQEAQSYLKGLKKGSVSYDDASEYLSYLQELQKAFADRESYYSQFKDEEEYNILRGISTARDQAKAKGESYNDYYLRTEQGAAKADEAYQAAQQKKAQMQQDVNNQRQYLSRTGILLVNGQVLRGKAAEDYLQQQQDAVNSVDQEIQQRAQEAEYARKVSGYAKAGRYADLQDLPDYDVRLAQGGRAWAEEQAKVNAGKASERDIAINANLMPNNGLGGVNMAAAAQVMRNDTSSREPQEDWTEQERNTFLILFQRSPEEAYDYAIEINSRNANASSAAQAKALSDWTNENGWRRAAAWGAGVLSQPFAAADYLDRVMQYNVRGYVMPHDQLSPADAADTMSAAAAKYLNDTYGTIGEGTPVLGGKGWGDVFQLSQSIAQSAAAATMGGGATNLLFFGSAANQGYQDAKARGASDGEALILGFLNGSAEVLGETFSVEKLIAIKNPATIRRYLWNVAKQGGIEASEETFTTLLNTFADELVMGDKSELQQNIRQLMAQGMSRAEAEKQAWQEWAEGLAGDALGGFLSGGISAGGRQAIGMIRSNAFAYSGEDAQRLVEAGLQQKAGSAAYKLAQKIQEQGTMSEQEAQRLTDLLGEDAEAIHRDQRAELVQEAQRRLQEAGMGQRSAARSAETVTKELLGEELDRAGRADRERDFRSETVRQVTQQMQQERRLAAIQRWQQAQQTRTQIKTGANLSEQLQKAFKASKLEISQEDLEILRDGYSGGQRMNAYVIAMRDGYRLGKLGMDYKKAAETSDYSGKVMPLQFQHAWELGMKAGGHELPDRFLNRKAELGSAQRSEAVTVKGQSGSFTMQGLTRGADGTLLATVKAADGSEQSVSLESLDFGDSGMGDLVQVLKNRSDAEQMFAAYKDGMNIGSFVRGWDTAKAYGQATGNRTVESVLKDSMLEDLDEKTIRAAFAYGRSLKEQQKAARGKSGPSQSQSDSSPRRGASQEASGKGGGVSYDGGTVGSIQLKAVNKNRLTPKQRAQIRVVEALGKQFGIRFVLFQSEMKNGRFKGFNGLEQNGVIYLDVNAGMYGKNMGQIAIVRTAAHELTHYMREFNEERYEELQEFLLDNLEEWKGRDLGQLVAQKMLRAKNSELDAEGALEEVVADGCEMMLSRAKMLQTMAEEKPGLLQAVRDWLQGFMNDVREAFQGVSALHEEARAVESWEQEKLEKFTEIWYKGLTEAAERAAKSPASEGGVAKQQERDANGIVRSDVDAIRSIGRKSINLFTPADIEKSRKWAAAYNKTLGSKSPFFRAWFGEWRSSSKQPVTVASIGEYKAGNEERKKQRGVTVNEDTGWEIRISREGETNTISHAGKDRLSELGLAGIRELVANAVLLDTEVHEHHDNNAADDRIAFDHRLYALGKDLNGTVALYRITVEETFQDYKHPNDKRFHNLKYIEKVADSIGSLTPDTSLDAESTNDASTTIYSVSDLYGYVKRFDSDFNVNPHDNVSSALLNEDGTPKVFYHGTNAEFWAFDKKKATDKTGRILGLGSGKGKFYLTEYQGSAAMAAEGARARTGKGETRVMQLYVRAEKVMQKADYAKILEKHYLTVPNSRPGSDHYDYKQRDKAIAAADKEVRALGYDAVYDAESGEMFVYDPTQLKSATDNIGTFDRSNPDIRFQEREDLPDDRALLMQARAEGRNAESLTAYQKKVRSLEALERKLRRQQDALEAAKNHEAVDEKGEPLPIEEQKKFRRQTMTAVQEQIRKTEDSIRRAEKALADMERTPQIRQETENALAAWREANPNDAARAIRQMQQERDSLREYVKLLGQEARLTTPENRRMLPSDIRKLARNLVKEGSSNAAVEEIAEQLQQLGDFMVEHLEGADTGYFNQVTSMARKIAEQIVSESYETLDENKETREGIRRYLREHTLRISDDVRGDIPDFNAWRKAHMGTLRLGNAGMDIDQAYQDLRSEYGEGLFPEDVLSRSDQLQQILEALDQVQPTYQQMFSRMEQEQAAAALGNEIVDRLLSKEVREKDSMADRAFQQRMKQLEEKYARKDRARQKALENAEDRAAWEAAKRDEAEERRREEISLRRQLVAEKVHELRERSIERDRKYRGRIAIDKKVVALSKIMLENSGKRHVPDAWKEAIGNFLASIDTLTQRSGEGSRSFHVERIEALREMVRKQQLANEGKEERGEEQDEERNKERNKEQGPQVFLDINPYLADMLKPFVALAVNSSTGTIQVENLDLEQMKELEEVLTAIREAVDKADVMLAAAEKGETLSKTAGETIRHLESMGKGKTGTIIRRFLSYDNLTPVFFFKRFGAGGERVFRELQRGWGKLAMNAKQIIDFSNATYTAKEAREWEQEVHEFRLIRRESDLSGRESLTKAAAEGGAEAAREAEERNKEPVKLSTAQIMGLYCLVKREQALGHILGGGIRIWDITAKPTLKGRLTGENVQEQAERYLVDEEDIAKITGTLTARQKEVADKLQRYMNTVGSAWGNEVSQARYGVDLFGEKNYYPISTDPQSRNVRTPDADGADLFHILNMGFTKNPVKNAKNGIVIHSIFDVFANHMADMAKYNSMGLPMLDAMKWVNYLDETDGKFTSVRKAMEQALGKNAERYFLGLIQDLNGNFEGGRRGEDIASKMISFSKIASVGANLRVAALQPTSYVRALAVLDPKYLLKGDNPTKIRQGIREALQYSGTAVWKDLGFFDLNINANMRDLIKHTDGALENIREKSMWGAEMGDKTTWGRLWNATKAEVQDKTGLTGEALLKATAERFDTVIYETQVMDSTMTRSHLMRQKGAFASMVTSFMSEPTLSYNLLLDAVSNWDQAKRSGKAVKQASLMAGRAFTVYAVSQVAASIVESIFSAMRDDDDYESFWEKWKQAEFGWDGNLVQDLVLHNKLPYVRDVVSILEGWTNKRMDTEWVEDLTKAYTAVKRDIENGQFRWGTAYAAMTALSTVTGLPIANTARDGVALWNTFVVQSVPDWKLKTVKRGTVTPTSSIKQAFEAGAISEEEAIRYLMRDAEIETEEKARQKVFEWGLEKGTKKYDKLLDAVRSGQDSKAARDELLQAGFSEDTLRSQVRSAVKEWYQGTAEDGRPRIGKEAAIRMLVKEAGMSQRDAEAKVREWSSYVSSPEQLQYEDIQDAFIAGEITAARAAEMRMLYGGKSKPDAQAEVQKWSCEKDTGIAYSDLKDAWLDGEISDSEAVEYQVLYGGKTKVKAEEALQQWRFAKDTGGDYSDVKEAFMEGALSVDDAIAARVDYGGKTRTDAQKEVRKWSCEKETGIDYDDMHDLYLSGELSAERAAQLRQTYGGQTKEDAEKEIRKWSCEKETGLAYDDLRDLYLSGEVSGSRAAELRVRYGGKAKEDAEKEVLHWQCEKDTGIRYDDIRDAYAGGQISAEKVQQMLQKYGGYSETEAEGKALQYRFAGKDAELADISPSAATTYYSSLEAAGVSKEVWYKTWRTDSTTQADKKANGKAISGSKKNKMVAYIQSLNLNAAQKDALYLALGYAKSGIRATPWH